MKASSTSVDDVAGSIAGVDHSVGELYYNNFQDLMLSSTAWVHQANLDAAVGRDTRGGPAALSASQSYVLAVLSVSRHCGVPLPTKLYLVAAPTPLQKRDFLVTVTLPFILVT